MKLKELYSEFKEMETENNLFAEQINGVYFWKRVRHQVYDQLRDEKVYSDNPTPDISTLSKFKRLYLLFRNLFFRNPFFSSDKDIVIVGQSRRKKIDDKWSDIYSDYLLEELDRSYVYLDEIYPGENCHKKPMKTSNVRYLDLIRFTPAFLDRLGLIRSNIDEADEKLLGDISDSIEERFDEKIDLNSLVAKDLRKRKIKVKIYKQFLKKVDPEIVFLVKATRYTLNEACEQLGIPTVEFQHGVIHPYHRGYSYPAVDNKEAYSAEYFFSWGNYWTDSLDLPFDERNVLPVGFPHFEERKSSYENRESDEVIFISQPNLFQQLSEEAINLDRKLPDYKVRFKVHPKNVDWEMEKPQLKESNVDVVYDEEPLYQMVSTASYQIGVSSTALFEGLGFGLKTIIYPGKGKEIVEDLLEKDYAAEASSAESIRKIIEEGDFESGKKVSVNEFFKPNAVQNMKEAIEKILN